MNIDYNTAASPSSLAIRVESRLNNAGGTAVLRLLRWGNGKLNQRDTWPVGLTEVVNDTNIGTAAPYVNASGDIRMQLQYTVIATFSAAGFDVLIDQAEIVPKPMT